MWASNQRTLHEVNRNKVVKLDETIDFLIDCLSKSKGQLLEIF